MDRRSVENMKLDRRLIGRRGWISEKDLQRELDELPDVSDKAASGDQDPESSDDTASETAADGAAPTTQPEPSAPAATPLASDTGSSTAIGTEPHDVPGLSGPTGSDTPLT